MTLTGAHSGLFNIYSMAGLILIVSLYTYPYAFLFTATSFELMLSEMEDAAAILGAKTWRIMRAVTIPLVLPGVVTGFIMAFLEAIADLGGPLLISVPARFQVITAQLFQF
jgi:iron(III) transport system permease protein